MELHALDLDSPQSTVIPRSFIEIDDDVCRRACQALSKTGYLRLREIEITVYEGLLTLTGHVPTYYLKQVAQAATMSVEGVEEIDNQIVVCPWE